MTPRRLGPSGAHPIRRPVTSFERLALGGLADVYRALGYRPAFFARPMMLAAERLLRSPSDWSVGERALFIAFVSARNRSRLCADVHGAVAAQLLGPAALDAVRGDFVAAPLSLPTRAMLAFLTKLTACPDWVTSADISALRRAGITERAIADGIAVCAVTSIMNRAVDALGAATPHRRKRAGGLLRAG